MPERARDYDAVLRDLLAALSKHRVDYALVGGAAVILHGLTRFTEDIDLFLPTDASNLDRLKDALRDVFTDPAIDEITATDLVEYAVVRYGPPDADLVIDLMTRVGEAFRYEDIEAQDIEVEGIAARVATPRTLYRMKRGTLRPKDRIDAEALRRQFHLDAE